MSQQVVDPSKGKRYVSERGRFELNANPSIGEVVPRDKIQPERSAAGFAQAHWRKNTEAKLQPKK